MLQLSRRLRIAFPYFFLLTSFAEMNVTGESVVRDNVIPYSIIVTGGELLSGKYADSHTHFITRTLNPLGFRCVVAIIVGDHDGDLNQALNYASNYSSLILVTGGLGPTKDDITREVLSRFRGIPLKENPEVIAHLEARFSVEPGGLSDNITRQGMTPVDGTYLPNPLGTAVGLVFEKDSKITVALPGPPRETRPMVAERLVPLLVKRFGTGSPGSSLQMRFVGIGESSIDRTIRDHLSLPQELEVSSLFEAGRVDLTFSLPGDGPESMEQLRDLKEKLNKEIGQYMYSDDGSTLEESVLEMLISRDLTLSLAEIGSGGAISASLNDLDNSATVFRGGLSAANQAKLVSLILRENGDSPFKEGIHEALLSRLCEMFDSKWSLLVTEPKLDQTDSLTLEVVIGDPTGVLAQRQVRLRGRGREAQNRLVSTALDMLRRELKKD